MYRGRKVGVVLPAFNEETQITSVVKDLPDFVDSIVVVDDKSQDGTVMVVETLKKIFKD